MDDCIHNLPAEKIMLLVKELQVSKKKNRGFMN